MSVNTTTTISHQNRTHNPNHVWNTSLAKIYYVNYTTGVHEPGGKIIPNHSKSFLTTYFCSRFRNAVLLEQLKLYEMLISHSRHQLLVHEPFLRPLLKLLMACQGEIYPDDVEKRLVLLLNQLCVLLMQNIDLLDLFFYTSNQDHGTSKYVFLIINSTNLNI